MYTERIRQQYEHFSPGYRRIADFLLTHYQEAAFMTAAEIGRTVRVDTALVVRFAQRLGYPGFPELLDEVQEDVKRDLRVVYEPATGDSAPPHIFQRNLLQDRNNLDYLLLHLDVEKVEKVIELLKRAKRIFVMGEGNANFLAEAFTMRLLVHGYRAHSIPLEMAGQASIASRAERGDVFVGLGLTATNPGVSVFLKEARAAGAQTVGIVASVANPAAASAEHVIAAPVRTFGVMPSWTAIAAVLHGLTQALAPDDAESGMNWTERTEAYQRSYAGMLKSQLSRARDAVGEYNLTSPDEPEA